MHSYGRVIVLLGLFAVWNVRIQKCRVCDTWGWTILNFSENGSKDFCVSISAGSSLQTIGTDGSGNQVLLTYGNAGQFAQLN